MCAVNVIQEGLVGASSICLMCAVNVIQEGLDGASSISLVCAINVIHECLIGAYCESSWNYQSVFCTGVLKNIKHLYNKIGY